MCNLPDKPRVSLRNVSENEKRGLAVRFLEEVKQEFRVTLHATLLGTPLVRDNRVRKSAHVVVVFQVNGEGVFHLSLGRAKGTSRKARVEAFCRLASYTASYCWMMTFQSLSLETFCRARLPSFHRKSSFVSRLVA